MRKLSTAAYQPSQPLQLLLARELEVENADTLSASELIVAIENQLGDMAALESTRWFLMSVLRHKQKANWKHPDESEISRDAQYELTRLCLASPEFAQSIKTVLKGDTCKYALVEFGRSRNPRRNMLSNSTVAYERANAILENTKQLECSLSDCVATTKEGLSQKTELPDKTTANLRRASRRGFTGEFVQPDESEATVTASGSQTNLESFAVSDLKPSHSRVLSRQEIAELEHALSKNPPRLSRHYSWFRFSDEESRSWLLGVVAGFAIFAAIVIIFF